MNDSIDTSEREAEEPRMLRLPLVEMAAEPAPPPVAAGYEPHPVGTGERIRRLERVNAELVEAVRPFSNYACSPPGECECHNCRARAALTSSTKEQP